MSACLKPKAIIASRSLRFAVICLIVAVMLPLSAQDNSSRASGSTEAARTGSPAHPDTSTRNSEASANVPLDSWIYPVLDRLAAFGLIPSQTSGLRPWTRAECRRQMLEADGRLASELSGSFAAEAARLLAALHRELDRGAEARGLILESLYARAGVIAGPPLNDSFHFGQTWEGDSGRPFGRGLDFYTGFAARAELGRFFASVRGEYQRAPGRDGYPLSVRQTIAALDTTPLQPQTEIPDVSRVRLLDTYIGLRFGDLAISVGKQALWWGPTSESPLSFGSNAEPTKNLKLSSVEPVRVGPIAVRGEFILGKLGGQQYTWRPWFNAQKLSFKLTENLEMGFTRWSIFWGVGHPITMKSLVRNFTSVTSPLGAAGEGRSDPGDRKGGFDFRYRVPGVRNWLTLYSDSYSEDDPSPLAAPRRAAINPGLYLARLPGVPRIDLRVEAPSTQPMGWDMGGQYNYFNNQYHSGNTNYAQLVGNPVGRDGRALLVSGRYWISQRGTVETVYRQSKTSGHFLLGGGTKTDAAVRTSLEVGAHWTADVFLQYERFWFPLLGGPGRNLSATMQLTWAPSLTVWPPLRGQRHTENSYLRTN